MAEVKGKQQILKAAKEKDILNRPITSTKIEFKKFPENKVQDQAVPWGNSTKLLFLRVLQIIKEDETLPNSSQGHQYSVIKSRQRHYKKDNYRPISLNIISKILIKILANLIQQYIKRIIHHNQVGLTLATQGWLNIKKSINVTHHSNKKKEENHTIISTDIVKATEKIQPPS